MQRFGRDRGMFVANSLSLATGVGASAAFGLPPRAALAQTAPRPIRRSERYDDSFITERKPYKWPGNNTLAVWFVPNVEVWHYDSAFGVGITPNPNNYVPDVFNYAWREYGIRVGLWRLADLRQAIDRRAAAGDAEHREQRAHAGRANTVKIPERRLVPGHELYSCLGACGRLSMAAGAAAGSGDGMALVSAT